MALGHPDGRGIGRVLAFGHRMQGADGGGLVRRIEASIRAATASSAADSCASPKRAPAAFVQ